MQADEQAAAEDRLGSDPTTFVLPAQEKINDKGKQELIFDEEEKLEEPPSRGPHELDCPLCQLLLHEPVTTSCGHNFCKSCIIRAQDYSTKCPICRAPMATIGPLHAVNSLLKSLAMAAFPNEYKYRAREFKAEARQTHQNMPLFVLREVVFPGMPLRLHVFEQRYINLMKNVLEGSRTFGMIVPGREIGCLVVVEGYFPIPDGRSMVNLRGLSRFRVQERWISEGGYETAMITILEDEDREVENEQGTTVQRNPSPPLSQNAQLQQRRVTANYDGYPGNYAAPLQSVQGESIPQEEETKETLARQIISLYEAKLSQNQLKSLEAKYGNLPYHSPEQLSYWSGAVLPINIQAKQDLLECMSTKERLYIAKQHLLHANQLVRPSGQQKMYSWIFFAILIIYICLF